MLRAAARRGPPPHPLEGIGPGRQIDDYVVSHRLGEGGMGVVYEALQPVIGKRVAIKVLRPDRIGEGRTGGILDEARAVSAIHHPGVVDIYNVGQLQDGQPYLVMELLEGEGLDLWLARKGPLSPKELCATLQEILGALVAVHAAGLVHRDLKPSNVFRVTPATGRPYLKLVDFGLAQRRQTQAETWIVGTPLYMAPEQLQGAPATVASDLYAIGAMAFELVTGDKSQGDEPDSVFRRQPERLRLAKLVSPPPLGSLIGKLLAPNPSHRPASAQAALDEVRTLKRSAAIREGPHPKTSWTRRLLARLRAWGGAPASPTPSSTFVYPAVPAPPLTIELSLADLEIVEAAAPNPIEPATLSRLTDSALDYLLTAERLPPFPVTAMRVIHLLQKPDREAGELTRLINQDPALVAQTLRRANSAFSGRGVEITSIRDAVVRLGTSEVAEISAAVATWSLFQRQAFSESPYLVEARRTLAVQALASALGASWLALEYRRGDSEKAFLGGLLHDIGKSLILGALAEPALLARIGAFDPTTQLAPLLEALHVDLGALMTEEWKLPAYLVTICRRHHQVQPSADDPAEGPAVTLASALIEMKLDPHFPGARFDEVRQSAQRLGLDRFQIRAASTQMADFIRKAKQQVQNVAL